MDKIDMNSSMPIELLKDEVKQFIQQVNPLFDTAKEEVLTNNLSREISFKDLGPARYYYAGVEKENDKYCITINNNYEQYLWGTCLYFLVYFDNMIQIPMMDKVGCNIHQYKTDCNAVKASLDVYARARHLINNVDVKEQWQSPSLEKPGPLHNCIGKANGMYCGAIAFTYAHELAHNFLGHNTYQSRGQEAKQEELDADDTAIDFLLNHVPEFSDFTYKAGIVASMASILCLDKDDVYQGDDHPYMDVRIDNAMQKLALDERDNLWGLAAFAINAYLQCFNIISSEEIGKYSQMEFDTYKDSYDYLLKQLSDYRKATYPEVEPRDWEKEWPDKEASEGNDNIK